MLDLTGILFSSLMMLMVIVRAVNLDHSQPWFQTLKRKDDQKGASRQPWKPRS